MKYSGKALLVVAIASLLVAPARAQTPSNQPTSSGVAQQFKSGADRVGEGAAQIGEGIKEGAIVTWEAIKAGAVAVAAKFNGNQSSSAESKGSGRPSQQSH